MIQNFLSIYKSIEPLSNFYFLRMCLFQKKIELPKLHRDQRKSHIMHKIFNHVVKSYENY